jgi:hypothetical protein
MREIDKLIDKLAIEAARSILAEETESPGSQELVNLDAAREILGGQYCPMSVGGNQVCGKAARR